ncbi:hypothetical protein SASPL_134645 [Salvia splendens]|uniref:mTERF domain-containing protein, mitochondrial n=1 Tax=Salvia splendens TaxID=180675 RepID=A0A8X8ZF35_SALSN|nr:uncharacterized protein LOC121762187 [Salvia splendens]KAG6402452.1 hypothetical protein SASPL_134645 [Salvia splendens]
MSICANPLFLFLSRSISSPLGSIPLFTTFWFTNTISPANSLPKSPPNWATSSTQKPSIRCSNSSNRPDSQLPSSTESSIKWRPRGRNIKPKITTLQDQGFSPPDIARIISSHPSILGPSLKNQIIPSLSIIKELMGSDDGLVRAVRNCTRVLSANLGKTLVPNLEFLKRNGVSADRIRVVFNGRYGYAFLRRPEVIRESFEKAKEMGLSVSSKTFIYGIVAIAGTTSSGGWEKRLQAFRDVGFTDVDVLTVFGKDPLVFLTSAEKLTRLLIGTGKYDISDIVRSPAAISYSVERRYEVRVRILGVLERKNLIEKWPSLQTLYVSSDAEFCERFVSPYLDHLGDVYSPKMS